MLDIGVPGVGSIFVSVALVLIFLRDLSLQWAPGAGGGWAHKGTWLFPELLSKLSHPQHFTSYNFILRGGEQPLCLEIT